MADTMTESTIDAKDKNTAAAMPPASLVTTTDIDSPKPDELAPESVITETMTAETKSSTEVDGQPETADYKLIAAAVPIETVAVEVDANEGNFASTEMDELNKAMASTTISTTTNVNDVVEQGQVDLDANRVTVIANNENVVITDNNDAGTEQLKCEEVSKKDDEQLNSTISSVFEDARDYIDEENYIKKDGHLINTVERTKNQPDVENGEDVLDEKEDLDGDKSTALTIPVPVDDDTNDPQYIPRRGKFYEHDDRMAYSTTNSEDSESDNIHEDLSGDDSSIHRHMRRRKLRKSSASTESAEKPCIVTEDGTISKKVLAISKVAATLKNPSDPAVGELTKKPGRKGRDLDSLDKWTHDLYDEQEQMPKSQDELLATYGYDIRGELEAPRARRHHKYGRAATTKYTRSWQDTKAYNGTKTKRGGFHVGSQTNAKNKPTTSDDYTTEFPTLNKAKPSESAIVESHIIVEDSEPHHQQQEKFVPKDQEKKVTDAGHSRYRMQLSSRAPMKHAPLPANINHHPQEQQNGGPAPTMSYNKNMFNRPSMESSVVKEKTVHVNNDFYNRKPPQHGVVQHMNVNPKRLGRNLHPSATRGHNFHQPQFNRDRYFTKGVGPVSSFSQPHHNSVHAGTGRTLHGNTHYNNHYNDQHYENESQPPPPTPPAPVVRSSKRYSVQSRRELPNPVLNFGGMPKTPQPQQQISVPQPNGLVMQEPPPPQLQQQQSMQIHQQPPPTPIQIQQYQPLQQLHHGMVLDHNSGMMVMAEPPIYHQLYAGPQYSAVTPVPTTGTTDDQNAATLQMLAQAAVYHPVSGATPPPPSGPPQQQPPETFMTTFYQPQQQNNKQIPQRRMNLAIPIVAPPESNQSQQKTINSPTTASTN